MAQWGLVVKWAPAVPEDLWVLEVLILLGQTKWDLEHQWQDQEDQEGQEDLEDQADLEGLEVHLDQVGLAETWVQVVQGGQWEDQWGQTVPIMDPMDLDMAPMVPCLWDPWVDQ